MEYNIVFINCIQSLMVSVGTFSKLVLYKAGQYNNIIVFSLSFPGSWFNIPDFLLIKHFIESINFWCGSE